MNIEATTDALVERCSKFVVCFTQFAGLRSLNRLVWFLNLWKWFCILIAYIVLADLEPELLC